MRKMQRQEQLECRSDAAVIIYNQYFSFAFCHVLLKSNPDGLRRDSKNLFQ
jgi:hypothetical protein